MLGRYLHDPWVARDDYIQVVLDRSEQTRDAFLNRHATRGLSDTEKVQVWKLLELQRHAMLMYTSCGWFFDELSGIETVQVIEYAGRVVQLAEELLSTQPKGILYAGGGVQTPPMEDSLETLFLQRLSLAKSNLPENRDGATIYEKFIKPTMVDLYKVGAHYAISSTFNAYPDEARIYCYTARRLDYRTSDAGKMRIAIGKAHLTSEVTQESGVLAFGVLHFGDHNIHAGIREFSSTSEYERLADDAMEAFRRADIPGVIRAFDRGFGADTYSLKSLFRDEQRSILSQILTSTLDEAEAVYRQLYEHHAPLMRFLGDLRSPLPKAFKTTAEYALNSHLRRALSADELDIGRINSLLEEASIGGVDLDTTTLEFTFRKTLERLAQHLEEEPANLQHLHRLREAVGLLSALPFSVTLWTVQNVCYGLLKTQFPEHAAWAAEGDDDAKVWTDGFQELARNLSISLNGA
jgi:hypothetical protein